MTVPHNIVAPQPMHHYRVPPTANLLDDLGIDVETYRQLQSIQARDISPNDYDLLLRLGQKSTTKTREFHHTCSKLSASLPLSRLPFLISACPSAFPSRSRRRKRGQDKQRCLRVD